MLRISRLADYGVVLSTRLASLSAGELRSGPALSVETGIPTATVAKILKTLTRHSLVTSSRGAQGGYRLSDSPEAISVAAVITALEGPIGVTECGVDDEDLDCQLSGRCDVRGNWQRINTAIQLALEGISLAEMARGSRAGEVLVQLRPRPDRETPVRETAVRETADYDGYEVTQ